MTENCKACWGSGLQTGTDFLKHRCPACDGSGQWRKPNDGGISFGNHREPTPNPFPPDYPSKVTITTLPHPLPYSPYPLGTVSGGCITVTPPIKFGHYISNVCDLGYR